MPVETPNDEYTEYEQKWRRCRDTAGGSDAVKEAKTLYLPKLSKQDIFQYDAYRMRALYYGAMGRTIQGLLGAVFRKDYSLTYPDNLMYQVESITTGGMELKDFARRIVNEQLTVGRVGVLVDADKDNPEVVNASIYTAENIVNWRTKRIAGKETLTMVVLKEEHCERSPNDPFTDKETPQYRVLTLGVDEKDNRILVYKQEVWRRKEGMREGETGAFAIVKEETVIPKMHGRQMDRIPFFIINAESMSSKPCKPPLLDLADVNLSHYRTSADLEHGAHYTALPTAWVAGFSNENKEFTIGSATAWVSEDSNATAGFLEFKGQGLESLRNLKKDKEQLMAILGARMLEETKKAAEAADTHRIRQSGEAGALTTIADTASEGIEQVLRTVARWGGASDAQVDSIDFELNTDFVDTRMQPQELKELMAAWQGGGMSMSTFLHNLKKGELLPDGRSIEEEKDLIMLETSGNGGVLNANEPTGNVPGALKNNSLGAGDVTEVDKKFE